MEIFTIFSSWLLPSILILSISCFFLYTLKPKASSKGAPNLPPNPPKLPIIGNLHQLIVSHPHETLWNHSQKYGPVMLLHIGTKPMLIVSSAAMAKEVLKTQDHKFCSRIISDATKRLSYNYMDIAFSPHSSHWRDMRKVLVSEFLGPKRGMSFSHVLGTEIESLVRSLSSIQSKTVVNVDDILLGMVQTTVCKVAFGKNYTEPFEGVSWKEMLDESLVMLNGSLGDYFPVFGPVVDRLRGWNKRLEKFFSNLDGYMEMIIKEHSDQIAAGISDGEKDFVHTLVELSSKDNIFDTRLTRDEMKALIMDVLVGAIDSTFVTMVWAMSEIARNPRVMQKLQSEIRSCAGKIDKVHELDVTKMSYLKMVVKEALRLHPAAPLLIPHECISHCQIGGYDIFPGTSVLINAWAIGRDSYTWGKNSTEFYPERFENLDADFGRGSCEMIPFGGGRRSCPAINIAPGNIEFTIGNLLYWFDWEVPGGVKNEDLNMEGAGFPILRKKSPLCLVPIKHMDKKI